MRFPVGDYQKGWKISAVIKKRVNLERPLLCAILRPGEEREAHADERRIKGVQRVLESEGVLGSKLAAFFQK
jgi:hypothetical protein